jgi:hypothetical protein
LRVTAFEYLIGAVYMTKAVLDDRPTLRGWVSLDVCILVPLSAFWTGGAQGVLNRYNEMQLIEIKQEKSSAAMQQY